MSNNEFVVHIPRYPFFTESEQEVKVIIRPGHVTSEFPLENVTTKRRSPSVQKGSCVVPEISRSSKGRKVTRVGLRQKTVTLSTVRIQRTERGHRNL